METSVSVTFDLNKLRSEIYEDYPTHFVASKNTTIRWLSKFPSYGTVQEFDCWEGRPAPEDNILRHRKFVLFECDHNAILELTSRLISGDVTTLEMLLRCSQLGNAVLGFDHFRKEPRILLYPIKDE